MKKIITSVMLLSSAVMMIAGCVVSHPNEIAPNSTKTPEIPAEPNPSQMGSQYKRITSKEAQSMMSDDVMILDVRTQEEFDGGHIRNAILLPYDEIGERAESVIKDKNLTVLVYCRTGRRSEIAARELIDMGYTNVFDFGGIVNWHGETIQA